MPATLKIQFSPNNEAPIDFTTVEAAMQRTWTRLRPEYGVATVNTEVIVVGDKKIQTLNHQFLGHDYPTDVLSFPEQNMQEGEMTLGSIVISADTALRQSRDAGISLEKETETLAVHGLLHLLDFHHQ